MSRQHRIDFSKNELHLLFETICHRIDEMVAGDSKPGELQQLVNLAAHVRARVAVADPLWLSTFILRREGKGPRG